MITGQRHPFLGRYRVGFDSRGRILAADVALYCNAGWSMDLSFSVTERAMYHSDNSYKVYQGPTVYKSHKVFVFTKLRQILAQIANFFVLLNLVIFLVEHDLYRRDWTFNLFR